MKLAFFFILNLIAIKNFSQRGTLIIGLITQNNFIAFAADSRGSYFIDDDTSKSQIAYVDSIEKIFPLKQFMLAVGGASNYKNVPFSQIIAKYNQTTYFNQSLDSTLKNFMDFLDTNFPLKVVPYRNLNQFFIAGYENSVPKIIALDYAEHDTIIINQGFVCNAEPVDLIEDLLIKGKELPFSEMLENTIYQYADRKNDTSTIGGPVSIAFITNKNEFKWRQNNFSNLIFNKKGISPEMIKNDSIKIQYLLPNGKELLLMQPKK